MAEPRRVVAANRILLLLRLWVTLTSRSPYNRPLKPTLKIKGVFLVLILALAR